MEIPKNIQEKIERVLDKLKFEEIIESKKMLGSGFLIDEETTEIIPETVRASLRSQMEHAYRETLEPYFEGDMVALYGSGQYVRYDIKTERFTVMYYIAYADSFELDKGEESIKE